MRSKTFTILIERDEDDVFIGTVPALPGCHSQAKTVPLLLKRIEEAIVLSLESGEEFSPLKFVGLQEIEVRASR